MNMNFIILCSFLALNTCMSIDKNPTEINAFLEPETHITQETTPHIIDRSNLSINEVLKEIQDFNDYMTYLHTKQREKTLMQTTQQKQQHLEEIQHLEIIAQKFNILIKHATKINKQAHTAVLKTLETTIDTITQTYEHGTLDITTFETVSALLQKIISMLEQHIMQRIDTIESLDHLTEITTSIKHYQTCKTNIAPIFPITYQDELQKLSNTFQKELTITSPRIQKIVAKELQEIQSLKNTYNNLTTKRSALFMQDYANHIPQLQLEVDPFIFLATCLEKITSKQEAATGLNDQKKLITILQKHTPTQSEVNRAIQYISIILRKKDACEDVQVQTIFKTDSIEKLQETFKDVIKIMNRHYQTLYNVALQTMEKPTYQSIEEELSSCQQALTTKQSMLDELENIVQELQKFLSEL